jgi:hypothetical protein
LISKKNTNLTSNVAKISYIPVKQVMNTHFCRVGKIKPNFNKIMSLKELESKIAHFVDDITKIEPIRDLSKKF